MLNILNVPNLDLLTVAGGAATIAILGFVVFFSNRRDTTNRVFLAFSLSVVCWSVLNYLQSQFAHPVIVLWLIRLTIFSATWYVFFVFLLSYVLLKTHVQYPKWYTLGVLPWTLLLSFLTLTPLIFRSIVFKGIGRPASIIPGYGSPLFALTLAGLSIGALILLFKNIRTTTGPQKKQMILIWVGVLITFLLQNIFNMIFPLIFDDTRFVRWGTVFTFPLIASVVYAIVHHHLLNVKIFATEVLTFFIIIVSLGQVILTKGSNEIISSIFIFLVLLSFSMLLIRSFRREIEQRESLRQLNEALDDLNHHLQQKVDEQTQEIRASYEVEKRARAELEQLDEAKNQFMMLAQHHLRTPLTSLRWYLDPLVKGEFGVLNPQMREAGSGAFASMERLSSLIESLLDVAQFKIGRSNLHLERTQIGSLIAQIVEELRMEIAAAKVSIIYEQQPDQWPTLTVDLSKIKEVFFVVLQNAVRYNHPDGRVVVSHQISGNTLTICFADTGVGVAKGEQQMLFTQLFYRGAEARKVDALGRGIGLSVARLFVEAHHGRIWLESEGAGKGSIVYVELPISGMDTKAK